jgi:hypothetical protein
MGTCLSINQRCKGKNKIARIKAIMIGVIISAASRMPNMTTTRDAKKIMTLEADRIPESFLW